MQIGLAFNREASCQLTQPLMAGITPDLKKRDYLLPPGCKDLIDVLRPRRPGDVGSRGAGSHLEWSRSGENRCELTHIHRYVAMVFESRALFTLTIISPGERVTADVSRNKDGAVSARLLVQMNTVEERAVRNFFARHDLPTPEEDSEIPSQFFRDFPVYLRFVLEPVPPDAIRLADFLAELLREVCGLSDESTVCFHYDELTNEA